MKLTAEEVAEARRAVAAGAAIAPIAAELGVHEATLGAAVRGRTWRWLEDPPPIPAEPTGRIPANTVLSEGEVRRARKDYANGVSMSVLAGRFGVSESAMWGAVHGDVCGAGRGRGRTARRWPLLG